MRKSAGLLLSGVVAGLVGAGYFFEKYSPLLRARSVVREFEQETGCERLKMLSEQLDALYVQHPRLVRGVYFSALETALHEPDDGFSFLFDCFRKPVHLGDRGRLYDVLDFFSRAEGAEQDDYLRMRDFEKCVQDVSGVLLRRPWLFLPESAVESGLLYDFAVRGEVQNFWINSDVLDCYAFVLAARNVGDDSLKSRFLDKLRCVSLFQYNRTVFDLCGVRIINTVVIDASGACSLDEVLNQMEAAYRISEARK